MDEEPLAPETAPVEVIRARLVPAEFAEPTLGATIPTPMGVCDTKLELAVWLELHTPYGMQNCVT